MNQRGQNVIELVVLVAGSMLALMIIFTVYSNQIGEAANLNDYHIARDSVRKIVDAANTVYYSGVGSEMRITVETPKSALVDLSGIVGRTVYLEMADGSHILDVADVNIYGEWQENNKYDMALRYDGNIVWTVARGFDIEGGTFFLVSGSPDTKFREFSIMNNHDQTLDFNIGLEENSYNKMSLDFFNGDSDEFDQFTIAPGESHVVELKIGVPGASAYENNSWSIDINSSGPNYFWNEKLVVAVEYAP